ncbi:MAG: VCBS repeat-containing protein [Planctomycetota bacterium]
MLPPTQRILPVIGLLLLPACSGKSGGSQTPPIGLIQDIRFETRLEIPADVQDPGLRSMVLGDFTGDGNLDVVATAIGSRDQNLVMLVGQSAKGAFSSQLLFTKPFAEPPGEIASGDFDGDGDLDLAVLFNLAGKVRILRNSGAGVFTVDTTELPAGVNGTGVHAADLDGDGRTDLVFGRGMGRVLSVRLAGPKSDFQTEVQLDGGLGANLGPMALRDLDLDGNRDIAVVDMDQDRLLVFAGLGKGAFGPTPTVLTTGHGPVDVTVADMDKDGNLDLLVADYFANELSWFQGLGKAGFAKRQVTAVDTNPFQVATGDIDKDGNLDVVLGYWPGYFIGIRRGDGKGGLSAERQFVTTGQPSKVELLDLDADGQLDVLTAATHARALSWFRGIEDAQGKSLGPRSPERFAAVLGLPVPTDPVLFRFTTAADFDGDGHADAMVSDPARNVCTVFRGDGDGRLLPGGGAGANLEYAVGTLPASISEGDFDRDGKVDVVVGVKGGLRFLLNRSAPGALAFDPQPPLAQPPLAVASGGIEVVAADIDGDGVKDLVIADYGGNKVSFLKGSGNGFSFSKAHADLPVGGGPLSLVVDDFDGDGLLDLAVSRYNQATVSVFKGKGDGSFTLLADLVSGARPNYLRSADFNGDGLKDLVVSNLDANTLGLYLNSHSGFSLPRELRVGTAPTALMAGDLNGDLRADILVSNAESADFYFLLGNGTGSFVATKQFAGTYQGISADLGDVDGDGRQDLVVASGSVLIHGLTVYRNLSTKSAGGQ